MNGYARVPPGDQKPYAIATGASPRPAKACILEPSSQPCIPAFPFCLPLGLSQGSVFTLAPHHTLVPALSPVHVAVCTCYLCALFTGSRTLFLPLLTHPQNLPSLRLSVSFFLSLPFISPLCHHLADNVLGLQPVSPLVPEGSETGP